MNQLNSYAFPPAWVYVREVIVVHTWRGAGETKREVLQFWSKEGELLAEHDSIHEDPVWPAYEIRRQIEAGELKLQTSQAEERP